MSKVGFVERNCFNQKWTCRATLIFRIPFRFQYIITEWKGEIQVGKLWNILQISRDLRDALAKILPAPMRESMALDVFKITRSRHSTFLKFTINTTTSICYLLQDEYILPRKKLFILEKIFSPYFVFIFSFWRFW